MLNGRCVVEITQSLSSNMIPSRKDKAGCWVRAGSAEREHVSLGKNRKCSSEMGWCGEAVSSGS